MRVALIGYGKMGHAIAAVCQKRGHEVCLTVDSIASDADVITTVPHDIAEAVSKSGCDVAIEFTHPNTVMSNLRALIPCHVPLVVGTTGWHSLLDEVTELVQKNKSYLFYASNFSVGVNLFYRIVSEASRLISAFDTYDVGILEYHHRQKADSPSGTALEIAKHIMEQCTNKTEIVTDSFTRVPKEHELHVASVRIGSIPGTHTVRFDSLSDTIELTHTSRNRDSLALGTIYAAEWLNKQKKENTCIPGVYTMNDIL